MIAEEMFGVHDSIAAPGCARRNAEPRRGGPLQSPPDHPRSGR
ncbi:hypothetical protein I551_4012 [Mycobacterium ulcerans str. Harvey]|uniref:Uncharacterized protein n=1 Tax=Mycobacterium ulcerans str. Harvey TaxID=1299332 RepID=A0ABP3AIJ4_MYCUL|nr:hypothetical protein I551_4012 [Mycobacterium ulcerans str. Harvey]